MAALHPGGPTTRDTSIGCRLSRLTIGRVLAPARTGQPLIAAAARTLARPRTHRWGASKPGGHDVGRDVNTSAKEFRAGSVHSPQKWDYEAEIVVVIGAGAFH